DFERQANDPQDSVPPSGAPIDLPVRDDQPAFAYRASRDRLVCVHYDARAVEFKSWKFSTGFMKRVPIDSYICPIEELKSFDYCWSPRYVRASFRVWTARGYLRIIGDRDELRRLTTAFKAIAGTRRPPLVQQTWFVVAIGWLVTILAWAAAIYFKII